MSSFYEQGYKDGYAHGELHGVFEGRALGREKGFEIWEEIGFYEGQASLLRSLPGLKCAAPVHPAPRLMIDCDNHRRPRVQQSAEALLELIKCFPTSNSQHTNEEAEGVDMQAQLTAIRSKYRVLCAGTFLRPRIQSTENSL